MESPPLRPARSPLWIAAALGFGLAAGGVVRDVTAYFIGTARAQAVTAAPTMEYQTVDVYEAENREHLLKEETADKLLNQFAKEGGFRFAGMIVDGDKHPLIVFERPSAGKKAVRRPPPAVPTKPNPEEID